MGGKGKSNFREIEYDPDADQTFVRRKRKGDQDDWEDWDSNFDFYLETLPQRLIEEKVFE